MAMDQAKIMNDDTVEPSLKMSGQGLGLALAFFSFF